MPPLRPNALTDLRHLASGKVREIYELDPHHLLLVTSNRVSAYDVVFREPIPHKAEVLNLLSAYWFRRTTHLIPNHLLETRAQDIFAPGSPDVPAHRGRVALARHAIPVRFECVVRGHLDGSAWKEYRQTDHIAGYPLPPGLQRYDRLPEPLFTPTTKAETGHDMPIDLAGMARLIGDELTTRLRDLSIALYRFAYDELAPRGLLLLDTKFEFGHLPDGQLILIDEIFTPDCSRFRPADPAQAIPLDKQFLRDALAERGFLGEGPAPSLAPEIIGELSARYCRAFEWITDQTLESALEQWG